MERFHPDRLELLPNTLPEKREHRLYADLNALIEHDVNPRYYMASGYLETLIRHRERQKSNGNNFGYRIVNESGTECPMANTLLATGGSGRERNLLYDPQDGIAGMMISGKKTPLNDKGIRVMTPTEWGKLQGFINYAFIDGDGMDGFSFPESIPDVQKYKQFGNSVTIPAVEEMARFMRFCLETLCNA
jgi:DNA (cytosine-5)-methyltransferase 1